MLFQPRRSVTAYRPGLEGVQPNSSINHNPAQHRLVHSGPRENWPAAAHPSGVDRRLDTVNVWHPIRIGPGFLVVTRAKTGFCFVEVWNEAFCFHGWMLAPGHTRVGSVAMKLKGFSIPFKSIGKKCACRHPPVVLPRILIYRKRWRVELFFDDIKTTLGMDVLRTKTPGMVCREILVHMIAYNLVRCLVGRGGGHPERTSFKGACDRANVWGTVIDGDGTGKEEGGLRWANCWMRWRRGGWSRGLEGVSRG